MRMNNNIGHSDNKIDAEGSVNAAQGQGLGNSDSASALTITKERIFHHVDADGNGFSLDLGAINDRCMRLTARHDYLQWDTVSELFAQHLTYYQERKPQDLAADLRWGLLARTINEKLPPGECFTQENLERFGFKYPIDGFAEALTAYFHVPVTDKYAVDLLKNAESFALHHHAHGYRDRPEQMPDQVAPFSNGGALERSRTARVEAGKLTDRYGPDERKQYSDVLEILRGIRNGKGWADSKDKNRQPHKAKPVR